MPEIKHQFTGGKMNKDVDERLIPNGEYRDAMNIQVSTSEGSAVGTVQNILGNEPGCLANSDSDFTFTDSQVIGSISDEKNNALYWLVSGPNLNLSDLITTISTAPPTIPSYASDYIMRKSQPSCEYVMVDKYAALINIGVVNDTSNDNQLVIPDTELNDMIVDGMQVTAIDVDGNTSNTAQVVSNEDVSDFAVPAVWETIPGFQNQNTSFTPSFGGIVPFTGTYTVPDGVVYINKNDWDNHPLGTSYIQAASTTPGSQVSFTLDGVSVVSSITSITENFTLQDASGLGFLVTKIILGVSLVNGNTQADWSTLWQTVHLYTSYNGGSNGTITTSPVALTIVAQVPMASGTGGIIIPQTSPYITTILSNSPGLAVSIGYAVPATSLNTGCVDSFTQITYGQNIGDYLMFVNDCSPSGTLISPLPSLCDGCDYVTFQAPTGGSGSTVIQLGDNLNTIAGFDYLFFEKQRVLNFDNDKTITGINIIDDMLFWTDNYTEPKKINISRSIEGTYQTGLSHTQLINNELSPPINLITPPITPLQEKHITVVRKSPTSPLTLDLITDRIESINYSGVVVIDDGQASVNSFTSSSSVSGLHDFSTLSEGDTFKMEIVTDVAANPIFSLPTWSNGTKVVLKEFDGAAAPQIPLPGHRIKGVIEDWGGNNFDSSSGPVKVKIRITSIVGYPPVADPTLGYLNYAIDVFDESEKLFEFKFPRFSYRYKYQDEEYSTFAPFTEVAFVPGNFLYEPKIGYNLGMTNRVKEIIIKNFITQNLPQDVVEIDLLYKDDSSPNIYIVDTIKPKDRVAINTMNEWSKNAYSITSDTIYAVVSSNQLLRPWDNVPRKALAQEVTGNRLVYGNYLQNYDLKVNNQSFYPEFKKWIVSDYEINNTSRSIKSLRDYQLGVVFIDKYDRETPIISSPSGSFKLEKTEARSANKLKVGLRGQNLPLDFTHYKFFIKETSGEYYNMAMDRFYDASDGNHWLSFPSSDRNKIDIDTFLVLKKGNNSNNLVGAVARYKVLAIESEAPDFIKTTHLNIGTITHDLTVGKDVFGAGSPITPGSPLVGETTFSMEPGQFAGNSLSSIDEIKDDLYVEFGELSTNIISNRYRIVGVTKTMGTGIPAVAVSYDFTIDKPFKNDVNFVVNNPVLPSYVKDQTTIRFYKYTVENKPEFDGRFFVKIYADNVFSDSITIDETNVDYRIVDEQQIYYLSPHHKGVHSQSNSHVFGGNDPAAGHACSCSALSTDNTCPHWWYYTAFFTYKQQHETNFTCGGSTFSRYDSLLERGVDWNDVWFIDGGTSTATNGTDDEWDDGTINENNNTNNTQSIGISDYGITESHIDLSFGPIVPGDITQTGTTTGTGYNNLGGKY